MANTEGDKPDPSGDKPTDDDGASDASTTTETEATEEVDHAADAAKWKALSRKHEKAEREHRKRLETLETEATARAEEAMTETDRAIAAAKTETEERLSGEYRTERLANALTARASGKMQDPTDAPRFAKNLADLDPGDTEALDAAIAEILEAKPYLAPSPSKPVNSADGGPKGSNSDDEPTSISDYVERDRKRRLEAKSG